MTLKLENGKHYHIYNRGVNSENIFTCEEDYLDFLDKMDIYLNPIAVVISWALLKNHFHLLVYIKNESEIGFLDSRQSKNSDSTKKWATFFNNTGNQKLLAKPKPVEMFKHFFNSYSRWFNIKHEREGSLVNKNYERKLVDNNSYFKNLIVYIHNNPVKHGFVNHPLEYPWSSHLGNNRNLNINFNESKFVSYFETYDEFEKFHDYSDDIIEKPIMNIIWE